MDIPRTRVEPTTGERVARGAVIVFLILAMVALAFALGFGTSRFFDDDDPPAAPVAADDGAFSTGVLDEIYELIGTEFVGRDAIDPELLEQAAINGVLAALNDPHTVYLTPEQVAGGALDLGSSYQGIGASVTDTNGQIEIIAPFRDSPAETAGIRSGDVILEVNGESTAGWSDELAVQEIRGTAGTPVTLTVQHTDGEIEMITIERGDIAIESVFTEPILEPIPGESGTILVDRDGNAVTELGYVNISQFHEDTASELRTAIEQLRDGGEIRGLIVDLRANPGGLLTATVEVADEFLDGGTILVQRDADGAEQVWQAREGGIATDLPIVIIQDAFSASGSEVLAAALSENGRATIVGDTSFGKGTVNRPEFLTGCGEPNCGALYLSIARWLTPNGNEIEGVGIQPDTRVELTNEIYEAEGDIQLFAAIDALRNP